MKNLYLILVLSALVACTGSSQKEKPACVNTPVEPFTGLPVFDLQEQYPEKEIILQDIADVDMSCWKQVTAHWSVSVPSL